MGEGVSTMKICGLDFKDLTNDNAYYLDVEGTHEK